MKFRYLISLAVATALLTGCNNEDDFGTKVTNGMLRATMESNASGMARAGFDANGAFYWSEGDRLGVTMQNGADYTTGPPGIFRPQTAITVYFCQVSKYVIGAYNV